MSQKVDRDDQRGTADLDDGVEVFDRNPVFDGSVESGVDHGHADHFAVIYETEVRC